MHVNNEDRPWRFDADDAGIVRPRCQSCIVLYAQTFDVWRMCHTMCCTRAKKSTTTNRMPTTNQQQVSRKCPQRSSEDDNESTTSWRVKMLYSLLYDRLLPKKSTTRIIEGAEFGAYLGFTASISHADCPVYNLMILSYGKTWYQRFWETRCTFL